MFWQHVLENKKQTFFACIPKQDYAAILESSKNNDFFRSTKLGSLNFLGMVSARQQLLERSEDK